MAELSHDGRSQGASTSSARTLPVASRRCIHSVPTGCTLSNMIERSSSNETMRFLHGRNMPHNNGKRSKTQYDCQQCGDTYNADNLALSTNLYKSCFTQRRDDAT